LDSSFGGVAGDGTPFFRMVCCRKQMPHSLIVPSLIDAKFWQRSQRGRLTGPKGSTEGDCSALLATAISLRAAESPLRMPPGSAKSAVLFHANRPSGLTALRMSS